MNFNRDKLDVLCLDFKKSTMLVQTGLIAIDVKKISKF